MHIVALNSATEELMKERGIEELKKYSFDGYEGSITGWLIPYVDAGYSVYIKDKEYEYKNGVYYANSVTTTFSSDGGVRKVQLGIKLGDI